jgi:hypothetical protein
MHTSQSVNRPTARRRELAIQLRRDVLPGLRERGVQLWLVSIGTPERGADFAAETGFPADRLLADPGEQAGGRKTGDKEGCCAG